MTFCSAGFRHSLFLDSYGSVWSCGSNGFGQLGVGDMMARSSPEKITNLPPIVSLSACGYASLFIEANGDVWSSGNNVYGGLGLGHNKTIYQAEKITTLPNIVSALGAGFNSLFLDYEGSVWSCGENKCGQLGLGDLRERNKAEKIEGLPNIKSLAAGWNHSLFLDIHGSVWACGYNECGQLGMGDNQDRKKAEKIEGLPKITAIAGGQNFSLFLDETGNVWSCGSNGYGELGLGEFQDEDSFEFFRPEKIENLHEIAAIAGGRNCSMFLDKHGNLFTTGCNQYGQLGLRDTFVRRAPEKVNEIPPIAALSSCNTSYFCLQFVDIDGKVWSCGDNGDGKLGLGTLASALVPMQVPGIPSLANVRRVPTKSARKVV